jgi:4'-phosphopantetheinyl transferase EntD
MPGRVSAWDLPAHVFTSVFFSIKESVFKAVFPTLRIALDWADCCVRVDWVIALSQHPSSTRIR